MVNNSIACKNLDEVVETQGGIIVPTKNKNYKRLKVTNLFEGHGLESEGLREGAEIYVLKNAGVDIPIDGEDFVVIKQQDILFIK